MSEREAKVAGTMGLVLVGIFALMMLWFIGWAIWSKIDVERRCSESGGYMKYNECIKLPKDDE